MDRLNNFIGQEHITKNLSITIKASKIIKKAIDHILFYGPPGLGKTTISKLIAKELNVNLLSIHGGNLKYQSDILSLLTKIKENDMLFIDEIHSVDKKIEEMLYSIMEGGYVDVILGRDITAKPIRLTLPPFTMIGATTDGGLISKPLLDRFALTYEFREYSRKSLTKIVLNYLIKENIGADIEIAKIIANTSRRTPRIAKNLISRIKDHLIVNNESSLSELKLTKIFKKLEINKLGLTNIEIRYLNYLNKSKGSKGLESISLFLNTPLLNIRNNIEPYLVRLSLCQRTTGGRKITERGKTYLKNFEF